MISGARVVVATHAGDIYNSLKTGLEQAGAEVTPRVLTVLNLDNILVKQKRNILIIDTDGIALNHTYIKNLVERHSLLVILMGTDKLKATPFLKPPVNDFFLKPKIADERSIRVLKDSIIRKINDFRMPVLNYLNMTKTVDAGEKVIAIASSTGGTEALEKILRKLPENMPPILVVQHMISGFTKLFADRLNSTCAITVKEATNHEYLQRGLALIAPTDYHMVLVKKNQKLMVECITGAKVHGVMPAADVLFETVAPIARSNAIGVILTGMGADGAKGLMKMRLAGSYNIGQDEKTCTVYGMPKVAHDLGALDKQLPLDMIAQELIDKSR